MQDNTEFSKSFESQRHGNFPPDQFDPSKPRLGRRESEPHSDEINYLYDVMTSNFPNDRVMWDLHHIFAIDDLDVDIVFDLSYFKDFQISERLSSYRAKEYNNRVPNMAINVLSKSTWRADIGEHVDYCRKLKIPLYIIYPAYHVANKYYEPPFLRAYILQPNGEYHIEELKDVTIDGENGNPEAVIDVSTIVPFRLGLLKRPIKHESNNALYRLVLLHPEKFELFLTKAENAEKKIDQLEEEIKNLKESLK